MKLDLEAETLVERYGLLDAVDDVADAHH